VGSWFGTIDLRGGWQVFFIVLVSLLSGPAAGVVIAGIVAALLRLTRRDRAIRRHRVRWMIPRHFEPDQYALVERAALAAETIAAADVAPLIVDDETAVTRHLWQLAGRARHVSELTKAFAASPLDTDELVAEAVAPAASIVAGSQAALAADVEAFEQLAAMVAGAEATQGVLARLAEVRRRTDRVAELVAEAKGDRPVLDDEVLEAKTAEARRQLDGLVAQARAQAAWVLTVDELQG
jgi:hypothetical protein